jgi:excinuclease ABC subunit A
VRLVVRVGRNTFQSGELNRRLGIPTLNDTPGVEAYGSDPRVWVTKHKGPWQSVTVLAHRLSEIDTPAFRQFLEEAVRAFQANLKRLTTRPEDVMPWKINGKRWHLGEKGFPVGRKLYWDRSLLPRLIDLITEVEPAVEIDWNARDAVTLRVPGITRGWAQWRTKDNRGLDCRFLGKKGQFNLSRVEGFGVSPQINGHRAEGDVLRLVFQQAEHVPAARLKEFLAEHLRGFREVFGISKG